MSDVSNDLINFRDVAKNARGPGFAFRTGQIYRSGVLTWPTAHRMAALIPGEISLVVDLRSPNERRSVLPLLKVQPSGALQLASDIDERAPHLFVTETAPSVEDVRKYYLQRYREMACTPQYDQLFGAALRAIATAPGATLVHCSAGKDRTGLFIAILLRAMDAPDETVTNDFLASNGAVGLERSVYDAMARLQSSLPDESRSELATSIARCSVDYLDAAFAAICERHGTLIAYLDSIGVDQGVRADLQRRLVD